MTATSSNLLKDLAWPTGGNDLSPIGNIDSPKRSAFLDMFQRAYKTCSSLIRINHKEKVQDSADILPEPRNRFADAVKRIEFSYAYKPTITEIAPYGYFRNRPIIGEGVRVNGGIFVGVEPHEALVVDAKYGYLEQTLLSLISRCAQIDESSSTYEYEVFSKTVTLVRETLRFSEEGVQQLFNRYNIQPDDKVTLDLFVRKKVGVARHQVLLAAFLLERCKEKNLIKGQPTIESQISDEIPQERLLFTSAEGEIFRFDATRVLGKTAIH